MFTYALHICASMAWVCGIRYVKISRRISGGKVSKVSPWFNAIISASVGMGLTSSSSDSLADMVRDLLDLG